MNTTNSISVSSLSNSEQIKERIQQLRQQLQQQLPGYESLLHTIHKNLALDPDVVQILTEEEIGVICAGLQKRTGVFIATEAAQKMVNKAKKGGKVDLTEL